MIFVFFYYAGLLWKLINLKYMHNRKGENIYLKYKNVLGLVFFE